LSHKAKQKAGWNYMLRPIQVVLDRYSIARKFPGWIFTSFLEMKEIFFFPKMRKKNTKSERIVHAIVLKIKFCMIQRIQKWRLHNF
jgi:hypothetical protein